ncbi:MAG: hypothetical protein ACRDXX_11215 [Stackebrandtia sp.]
MANESHVTAEDVRRLDAGEALEFGGVRLLRERLLPLLTYVDRDEHGRLKESMLSGLAACLSSIVRVELAARVREGKQP